MGVADKIGTILYYIMSLYIIGTYIVCFGVFDESLMRQIDKTAASDFQYLLLRLDIRVSLTAFLSILIRRRELIFLTTFNSLTSILTRIKKVWSE